MEIVAVFDSSILQGLSWGLATLGLYISLRIFRFPDLTVDGSFGLGGAVFASLLKYSGYEPSFCLFMAVLCGAFAGIITGILHVIAGIGRLLSGILVMTALYSINFRILGNKPNLGFLGLPTVLSYVENYDTQFLLRETGFHLGLIVFYLIFWLIIATILIWAYQSELGLTFRFAGYDRKRADALGFKSGKRIIIGLSFANALVALSGALVAQEQSFADVSMGSGLIVITLASLLIGEQIVERLFGKIFKAGLLAPTAIVFGPIIGTFTYYLIIHILLGLSQKNLLPLINIQPTDLKLITALAVVATMWFLPGIKEPIPREETL